MNTRRRTFIALIAVSQVPMVAPSIASGPPPATPKTSADTLRAWLSDRGIKVDTLTIPLLVLETLAFYEEVRFSGLVSDPEGDMLLYQWGTYNWGRGENFQFGITRQFIENGKAGDDAITQLHFTALFTPTDDLRRIQLGTRWCRGVDEVEGLRKYIETSEAFKAVHDQGPRRITIEWSPV